MNNLKIFELEKFQDSRGGLAFCNSFDLAPFKRFYIISPASLGQIRAWQAHKKEKKAFLILKGRVKLVLTRILNWETNEADKPIVMELDYESPQLVIVPGGYANGFQFLTKEGELLVFSDYLLEESQKDDYRFEKDLFYSW